MPLDIGVYGARGIPSTYSGYETFLSTLLPQLVERGHRVTMYCRTGEGLESTPWKGVHRSVLPAIGGKNFNTLSHGFVAALAARRAGHDAVLVVNVANAAYTAIGRYTGQPVILNTDGQEWNRDKWGSIARRVFRGSARIADRCATGLIADCRGMHDVYRDEFGAHSTIIPYCAPTLDWRPSPATPAKHCVKPGRYLVIAGRHNPENNIHRIAEIVSTSELPTPLLVLGTANYDSPVTVRLRDLAARDDRIRLIGHVDDRDEFLDLLHHAALYLHGHSVGGINPSIIEAMSAGARIVALDTTFNREVLGPAANLFTLTPPTLIESIAAVLAESADDRAGAREAAAARVGSQYSVESVTDAYEALLVSAAGAGRRRAPTMATRW